MSRKTELLKAFESKRQQGFPVIVPNDGNFKDGDKFTIAGVRWMEDGTIIRNCKPGEETIMTAKITNVKENL